MSKTLTTKYIKNLLFVLNTQCKCNINLEIEIRVIHKNTDHPQVNTSYNLYNFNKEVMEANDGRPEKTTFYRKVELVRYLGDLLVMSRE